MKMQKSSAKITPSPITNFLHKEETKMFKYDFSCCYCQCFHLESITLGCNLYMSHLQSIAYYFETFQCITKVSLQQK